MQLPVAAAAEETGISLFLTVDDLAVPQQNLIWINRMNL